MNTAARRILNGRYALLPNPKAGGMADVYCATDLDSAGQKVAVKLLRYLPDQDAIIAESFRRETDALRRLEHPNIVKLIEAGQDADSGRYFLVLEWLDSDLAEHIQAHPYEDWDDYATHLGAPILDALDFAHSRRLTHRDIKPANILIANGKPPKLADFGIAKLHAFMEAGITLGDFASRPYAPPDAGEGQFYFSRDIYSFAVVAVRCLAGRELRDRDEVIQAFDAIALPDEVRAVLRECLSLEPAARPAHGGVLRARLDSIQALRLKAREQRSTCWIGVPVRDAERFRASMDLPSVEALRKRLSEELHGPCAIERYVFKNRDASEPEKRPHFRIHAGSCRLHVTVEDSGDHLFVFNAWPASQSDCEKAREYAWESPFDFRLGKPRDAEQGRDTIRALVVGVEEHEAEVRALRAQRGEQRLFETWRGLLKARLDLERERTPPIHYTSWHSNTGTATFTIETEPREELVGTPWRIRLRDNAMVRGEIQDIGADFLTLDITAGDAEQIPSKGTLEFDNRAADAALGRQQNVLDNVRFGRAVHSRLRDILTTPAECRIPDPVSELTFLHADLDEAKRRAVQMAVGVNDFVIVEGPPGTGKTTFIAETIVQLLRRDPAARVLLTSQTHVALDNALERLRTIAPDLTMVRVASRFTAERVAGTIKDLMLESAIQRWRTNAIRSGDQFLQKWAEGNGLSRKDTHVGLMLVRLLTLRDQLQRAEDTLVEAERGAFPDEEQSRLREEIRVQKRQMRALESELRKQEELAEELIALDDAGLRREIGAFLPDQGAARQLRSLMELHGAWSERFGIGGGFAAALLSTAHVVAGTCLGVVGVRGTEDIEYDYCIVDEASKATATEVLVPMSRSRRFIIVGDPRQLSPFQDPELVERGLLEKYGVSRDDAQQTLLDLLADGLPSECLAKLTVQHRMVKPIGDMISHCFYGDELDSSRTPSDHTLRAVLARPVTWLSTSAVQNRREENSGESFANQAEIKAIGQLLANLDKIAQRSSKRYSVAILSGYAGQVIALQRQIGAREIAWPSLRVEVNTVDAFQGREADIAIYSITRSNPELRTGFLSEQKRLNVALSRGRDHLVIVGDHQFSRALPELQPLQRIARYVESHPADCLVYEVTQ
jgi:AAA domain/Protein kinase domain